MNLSALSFWDRPQITNHFKKMKIKSESEQTLEQKL